MYNTQQRQLMERTEHLITVKKDGTASHPYAEPGCPVCEGKGVPAVFFEHKECVTKKVAGTFLCPLCWTGKTEYKNSILR